MKIKEQEMTPRQAFVDQVPCKPVIESFISFRRVEVELPLKMQSLDWETLSYLNLV